MFITLDFHTVSFGPGVTVRRVLTICSAVRVELWLTVPDAPNHPHVILWHTHTHACVFLLLPLQSAVAVRWAEVPGAEARSEETRMNRWIKDHRPAFGLFFLCSGNETKLKKQQCCTWKGTTECVRVTKEPVTSRRGSQLLKKKKRLLQRIISQTRILGWNI